jgi:hypothetical protein
MIAWIIWGLFWSVSLAYTAYQWGVYTERVKWNDLIETGKLPRPSTGKE